MANRAHALVFTAEEASWLTSVNENFSLSFCCRNRQCLYYGPNHEWILHFDRQHHRCPRCLDEYKPWSEAKGQVPFQKVVVINDLFGTQGGDPHVFPAKWPGSEADSWLLSQAELYASKVVAPENMGEFYNKSIEGVHALCKRIGTPKHMVRFTWNPAIEHRLAAAKWPREGELGWQRLKDGGFSGNILPTPPAGQAWQVFNEWHELIALIGNVIYCSQNMLSKM